jgi:hypothetical protein
MTDLITAARNISNGGHPLSPSLGQQTAPHSAHGGAHAGVHAKLPVAILPANPESESRC